jgi:hypothetical protein
MIETLILIRENIKERHEYQMLRQAGICRTVEVLFVAGAITFEQSQEALRLIETKHNGEYFEFMGLPSLNEDLFWFSSNKERIKAIDELINELENINLNNNNK